MLNYQRVSSFITIMWRFMVEFHKISLLLKMAIYSEFSHEKWWFSIVMLNYQRVIISYHPNKCRPQKIISPNFQNHPQIMPGLVPQLPRPPEDVEAEIHGAAQGGLVVTDLIGGWRMGDLSWFIYIYMAFLRMMEHFSKHEITFRWFINIDQSDGGVILFF